MALESLPGKQIFQSLTSLKIYPTSNNVKYRYRAVKIISFKFVHLISTHFIYSINHHNIETKKLSVSIIRGAPKIYFYFLGGGRAK